MNGIGVDITEIVRSKIRDKYKKRINATKALKPELIIKVMNDLVSEVMELENDFNEEEKAKVKEILNYEFFPEKDFKL